ncbi:MAG TPA: 4-(cytidine 5'-diphospho)-2-C-methyl-D-erythritol kinase [Candidatus Deferrimicrobium sp.]|nr:4-(cytidine 5'-diphospho)-2-C-methyl-D-erythritol kinase [Candidatus Deferrimicrobium sp.]
MKEILELAHAKVNFTLDVLGRRPDGYHEVEMVMQTLELADSVVLKQSEEGITLTTTATTVPTGPGNLAWKAAKLMFDKFDLAGGVAISLEKHIPVSAGLAGGSADAAAVIRGINRLWGLGQSIEQLCALGAKIGSDIPFCIIEGTAIARGRGEVIEKISPCPKIWVILVKPHIGVSTAEVYGKFSMDKVEVRPETTRVIEAINQADSCTVAQLLCNVLESVTVKLVPEVALIKDKLIKAGVINSLMSGSGPTVFGIARDRAQAEAIAKEFDQANYTVVVTQTYNA